MAAADNSTVKITIDVVDATSSQVLAQTQKNIAAVGATAKTTGGSLGDSFASLGTARGEAENLGAAFEKSTTSMSKGMQEVGGHTISALDKVRLLRDDLGIRIPRAMENVIARSPVATAAIGAIGSGLVALGAIEIFARMGTAIYEYGQRLLDVNVEMRKFTAEMAKSAHQELFDNASIETTRSLLAQVAAEKAAIDKQRTDAGVGMDNSGSLTQWLRAGAQLSAQSGANPYGPGGAGALNVAHADPAVYTGNDDKRNAAVSSDEELLRRRQALLARQIELQKAQDAVATAGGTLQGRAAENAKTRAKDALDEAKRNVTQETELYNHAATQRARLLEDQQGKIPLSQRTQVYQVSPDAGKSEYERSVTQNHREAGVSTSAQDRKNSEETQHAQAEAHAATLRGEAKFAADYAESQRQLRQQHEATLIGDQDYYARSAAMDQKFQAERSKRLEDEHAETLRMQSQAAQGGQTGMARIDAQTNTRLTTIAKEAPGFSDSATAAQREAAVRQEGQAEQQRDAETFNERLKQLDESRADSSMSANQRIDAATRRTQQEILKAWQEMYGQLGALDSRRVQSYQAVQQELSKIDADGQRQKQQARQSIADETRKMQDEASRRGLSREQEQQAAIVDEYNERYRHLEELRVKDADNADLYRQQEIAAEEIKNGKLVEQQRAMRDKLAGELRGFMTNPMEALKKMGEDAASKYAADLLLKAGGHGATAPGGPVSKMGSLFDLPFGHKQRGQGSQGGGHTVASTASVSAASTTMTLGSATINVATATLTSMAGGNGAALPAQAAVAAAGGGTVGAAGVSGIGVAGANGVAGAAGAPGSTTYVTQPGSSADAGSGGISSTVSSAGTPWAGSAGGLGTTSGSFGDNLGVTGTSGPASVGFTSTGGPAVAAAQARLGVSGAGNAPTTGQLALNRTQAGVSMGESALDLGKQLFSSDSSKDSGGSGGAGSKAPSQGEADAKNAISGGMGLFAAYESNGGVGGALTGAMSGAKIGGMLGGPIGTAIGAIAGGIMGALGFGGADKAKDYDTKTVKPRIAADLLAFEMGSEDYQSAYDDLSKLDMDARAQTKQWGPGGEREYNDAIKGEIKSAMDRLTREQKSGRSQYGMTAAQFHNGGLITDFGSMSTTGDQGFIHAQKNEFVMQQQAVPTHYQAMQLMNSGASHSDMANYYGGSGGGGQTTAPASSSSSANLHFHSPDAAGAYQLFMDNRHHVRAALNASYAENSGGADA